MSFMALKAKYTTVLQVPATAEMRQAVTEIADAEDRSVADVCRDLIQSGLDQRA
jgi:hypothetical protein